MIELLSIRAGTRAIQIIQDEGLKISRVKVLAGASGSAKFLVLTGIDRALVSLFSGRKDPLYLLGTSIGAFRMAAFCQPDPLTAIQQLETAYIDQQYSLNPSPAEIADGTRRILDAYIDDRQIKDLLGHPFMRINFLSSRCKGPMTSDHPLCQWGAMALAAGLNLVSRSSLKLLFHRALFCSPEGAPPFSRMDQFPMARHSLTVKNFKTALLSSGSIPLAMPGVSDIHGVPGVFRDGGILDYHLDIPFLPESDNLVLYPHFYDTITPGWFDKPLKRKPSNGNMENVVLISPSRAFVETLPFQKIPDRRDFYAFKGRDQERKYHWRKAVDQSRRLGDALLEAIFSNRISRMVRPLSGN